MNLLTLEMGEETRADVLLQNNEEIIVEYVINSKTLNITVFQMHLDIFIHCFFYVLIGILF